jgi:hypothetical protein
MNPDVRPTARIVSMVPPDVAASLERLAREADRSLSAEIRRAVTAYVNERERVTA